MVDISVPLIEYNDFSLRLHKKADTQRLPLVGALEVTFRCNFRCIHCYCVNESPRRELSFNEIRHLLDQMADEGCLWMLLTGGEPLVRTDFPDIYQYMRGKGMIVTVFTNGSLMTEEIAEMLGNLKPFVVEITLYGASPETYKTVTGKAEHFQQAVNGIDLLRRHGVPLKLKTMIFRENVHELKAMRQFAESRGIEYRFDPVLNAALSGKKDPIRHMLSPEEIVQLDIEDKERMKEWQIFCGKFIGTGVEGLLFKCGAGQWGFQVDPEGKLSVCTLDKKNQYDLRTGTFKEAFYDFIPRVLSQKTTRVTKCATCNLVSLCGQCPAQAYLYNGDPEEPVDFLCAIAHARAKAFGVKVSVE